ncbi:unnamed protein product [Amoebophrya sp. A25]|nr:unnamed protein product [Amoebophrya sp. A25]|eukprot:GSA25T00014987001.1
MCIFGTIILRSRQEGKANEACTGNIEVLTLWLYIYMWDRGNVYLPRRSIAVGVGEEMENKRLMLLCVALEVDSLTRTRLPGHRSS